MKRRNLFGALGSALLGATLFAGSATAFQPPTKELEQVHVGVLLNGTASWEMQVIKDMGLDEENGFELVLKDVSGKQASHVALMSGDVDIVPHSYAVGGLMVSPDGPIASITDLPGKTIGIAGGPVDKSWVILQAYYMAETGETLADKVTARFGAPPLINELLTEGQIDASLNFWHFNARAKAGGAEELISVDTMMTEMGIENRPPLLAWVFRDETAAKKRRAIKAFLDASFAAKAILLEDDEVWEGLREKMRATDDDALFTALRDDYRAGILRSYDDETIAAAAASFAIMAEHGGPDLVGESTEMDPGTFWSGYSH